MMFKLRGSLKWIYLVKPTESILPTIAKKSQLRRSVSVTERLFHSVGSNQKCQDFDPVRSILAKAFENISPWLPFLVAPVASKIIKVVTQKKFKPRHIIPPEPCFPVYERKVDLHTIEDAFKNIECRQYCCRAVYLTGMPGIGKSELARQFAESSKTKFDFVGVVDVPKLSEEFYRYFVMHLQHPLTTDGTKATDFSKLPLNELASEKILKSALKQWKWLLVLDNYNSQTIKSSMIQDDLLKKLLPLPGSKDWGEGSLLITTTDTIIAGENKDYTVMRLGRPSINDGQTLLCKIVEGNYEMSPSDKAAFKEITNKQHWRLFPSEIVYAGREIQSKRKLERTRNYNFSQYCEDNNLKSAPLKHPNESAIENLAIALTDESASLKTVFSILALCPKECRIPLVLFEQLFEMLQVNVTDEMEKVKGCVLIDCTKESDSHTGSVSIHELTRKNFQNLFWKMSEDHHTSYQTQQRIRLMAKFIECITKEYEDLLFESYSSHMISKLQWSLEQLLGTFLEEYINNDSFPKRVKLNALCVLSNARVRSLNPESALCLLSPCFTDINDESTANDVTNEERANLYYHDGKISRRLNDVDKAMQSLNKAIHLSSDHKKLILMRKERALLKRKLGDYYGAMNDLQTMARLCRKHLKDKFTIARVLALVGRDLYEALETEQGLEMTKEAVEICYQQRVFEDTSAHSWRDPQTWFSKPRTHNANDARDTIFLSTVALRGMVLSEEGRWKEAYQELKKAQQKVFQKKTIDYAAEMNALVDIAGYRCGTIKKLGALKKQGKSVFVNVNSKHQFSSFFYLEYAKILFEAKQWKPAETYASYVVASIESAHGNLIHPKVAQAHHLLVKIHLSDKESETPSTADAMYHCERACEVFDNLIESAEKSYGIMYVSDLGVEAGQAQQASMLVMRWKKMKRDTLKLMYYK